jgi:glycosyltransferase involved in cell wall biosynthesis
MSEENEIFVSVVVPVLDEEGAVAGLHARIVAAMTALGKTHEIIFVNDGSKDNTLGVLKGLAPIKIVNLRRNFGQTAAMDAGIKAARGRYIATLDGDGQNDPGDIARLIASLEADGLDVVSGWRKDRHDTFGKKFASRCAARLRRWLINDGIHDSGCTLKVYRRECFENLHLYGEMHRFIPALLKMRGFRIGELPVTHHARTTGRTKYNLTRGVKGCLDMVAVWFWEKYASRPLHLFGTTGLVLILVSVVAGVWALYKRIFLGMDLSDTAMTMLAIVGFMTGVQFLVFGLMADVLAKTFYAARRLTPYNVKEIIER